MTVCFERAAASDRDSRWKGVGAQNFTAVQLELKSYKEDRSKGNALRDYIKKHEYDFLIFTNYVSPATMKAILYCKFHRKKYYIEYDGGFYKKDGVVQRTIKKYLLGGASGHFTTCEEHIKYLRTLGIKDEIIWKYPFTSVTENDLVKARELLSEGKDSIRKRLGITENKVVLSIGQFIPRKGFDVLLNSASQIDKTTGVYIVGGIPTAEYIELQEKLKLDNVHFVGFKTKAELAEYYAAADIYVMPTREDIWGLVINEAMAYGLPIVSSDACIAALEMVIDGENGYIVPSENADQLAIQMQKLVSDEEKIMLFSARGFEIIKNYTIEKMVKRHFEILTKNY